jgi:hypothetical protein
MVRRVGRGARAELGHVKLDGEAGVGFAFEDGAGFIGAIGLYREFVIGVALGREELRRLRGGGGGGQEGEQRGEISS